NQVQAQIAPLDPTLAGTLVDSAQAIIDILDQGNSGKPGKITALANRVERKLHLEFAASRGPLYIVERSTNLTQWEKIAVATDLNNGTFQFDDPNSGQSGPRFYRVVVP